MPSLIDKIDNLGNNKSTAMKSDFQSLWSGYSGFVPSGDLSRDEYGAAAAYAVIAEVFAAMAVWETFLDGVTWIVRDKKTGEEIARTDTQNYPLEERGGKWFAAIKRFESSYFHSYWKSLAFSDWLYGNSYIALLRAEREYRPTSVTYAGVKWLNPLNTSPQIFNGKIQYYQYNGLDSETAHQIPVQDIAYRIHRRDAFNDLLGYSGVLSAMDAINLSRNAIKAFKNFFSNGMQLGGVIMPIQGESFSNIEHENARREFADGHKGTVNAGRWAILRKSLTITPFTQENASQNFTVTKELRNQIFMALSVPPQLAGDPSDATYDNAKDIKRQWWETFAIPYAKDIAGFNSTVLIPKLEPDAGVYVEADTSAYEIEDPDVISQDVNAGIIDISTARMKRGYPINEKMQGVYVINGVPMHEDVIAKIARAVPSQYALDIAQADKAQAEASGAVSTTDGTGASGTDDSVTPLNEEATNIDGFEYRNGVAIPQKEIFGYHIDAGIVDINEARAQLGLPPKKKEEANELQGLQVQLSIMNSAVAAGISTLAAAEMVGLVLPDEAASVAPQQVDQFRAWVKSVRVIPRSEITSPYLTSAIDEPLPEGWTEHEAVGNETEIEAALNAEIASVGHKHHAHSHDLPPLIQVDTISELDELAAWRKFVTNGKAQKRSFEPKALRGDIGDALQSAVDSHDKQTILDAFHLAATRIETRVKAIQATRLDFEGDFDELLKRARAEKMGRVQWASAMRSILRRYGTRAYIDGLADGGIEDDPTEDDLIAMNELHSANSGYVTELGNVLYKEDGISDAQADVKATLWYNKSVNPYYQAGLLSADANGLYEWIRKRGKDSCTTCIGNDGKRLRLKAWKARGMPKSEVLECGGFECECGLIRVRGRSKDKAFLL